MLNLISNIRQEAGTMLIKNSENLNKGAPWEDDKLDRQEEAEKLTKILDSTNQPFVISVDSSYGGGKSFFMQRWAQDLRNTGYQVVYFNAWETDYLQDPFMAICSEFDKELLDDAEISEAGDIQEAAKSLFTNIAFNVLAASTAGIITAETFSDALEASQTLQVERYKAFSESQKFVEGFTESLRVYADKVREPESSADQQKPPIYVFIDELDRCRPDYAIEVLETIKHLFNVKNYVFIIGVDKKQLCSFVTAVYGDIEADLYLKKFIDWDYKLSIPAHRKFASYLCDRFGLSEFFTSLPYDSTDSFLNLIDNLSDIFDLSLRDIEQYMIKINMMFRLYSNYMSSTPILLSMAFLVIIKGKTGKEYTVTDFQALAYGEKPIDHVAVFHKIPRMKDLLSDKDQHLDACLRALMLKSLDDLIKEEGQLHAIHQRGQVLTNEKQKRLRYIQKVQSIHRTLVEEYGFQAPVIREVCTMIEEIPHIEDDAN